MALEDAGKEVDVAFTRDEPKGLAYENPFAGVPSFLRRKLSKDLSGIDLAITGIPFDQAVTHRTGTRFGPRAVREASTMIACDGQPKPACLSIQKLSKSGEHHRCLPPEASQQDRQCHLPSNALRYLYAYD